MLPLRLQLLEEFSDNTGYRRRNRGAQGAGGPHFSQIITQSAFCSLRRRQFVFIGVPLNTCTPHFSNVSYAPGLGAIEKNSFLAWKLGLFVACKHLNIHHKWAPEIGLPNLKKVQVP